MNATTAFSDIAVRSGGTFKLRISNCKFVFRKVNQGTEKMLRFTLTWVLHWQGMVLGTRCDGCLAYRWFDERADEVVLIWSPPKTRNGRHYHLNVLVSSDLYEIVKKKIAESGYAPHLGPTTEFLKELKAKDPKTYDPDLPSEIEIDDDDVPVDPTKILAELVPSEGA